MSRKIYNRLSFMAVSWLDESTLSSAASAGGEKHGNHGLFQDFSKIFRPATLTLCAPSCTMNWLRALSSAVRAFGLHPKGRPFKSDSAHHCDSTPFSGDVVQLVRTLPPSPRSSKTLPILASGAFVRQNAHGQQSPLVRA